MDIIKMNYLKAYEKLHNTLQSTKFNLAQFDVLTESIRYITPKELQDTKLDSTLSSLGTKLMQLNVGLAKIKKIKTNTHSDHAENHVNGTANQFLLYSILDEFQLNDSEKPTNIHDEHGSDSMRFGFISHIVDVAKGLVYILEESSMPDPIVLYGNAPKRLTGLPMPGEMFAYWYQDKYLVRAIRSEYSHCNDATRMNQFSAQLIDIGCVVHIDIKPNFHGLYEVTSAAKIIPSYIKLTHLCDIPNNTCVYDLLHSRVQYKVLHSNNEKMFANILKEVVNPFVEKHQKEWNFYNYLLPRNVNLVTTQKIVAAPTVATPIKSSTPTKASTPAKRPNVNSNNANLNPFADPSQYHIQNITFVPVIDKNNPFYFDPNEKVAGNKAKFQNFRLTKILNNLSDEWIDKNLPTIPTMIKNTMDTNEPLVQKKLTHGTNDLDKISKNAERHQLTKTTVNKLDTMNTTTETIALVSAPASKLALENRVKINKAIQVNPLVESAQKLEKAKKTAASGNIERKISRHDNINKELQVDDKPSKTASCSEAPKDVTSHKRTRPTKMNIPVEPARVKPKIVKQKNFLLPEKLPQIGDTMMILYQYMISVEEFYAVIRKDPTRYCEVDEFSLLFNFELNNKKVVPYNEFHVPKLFDKVIALYEDSYYRAQVVKIIDKHVFQVFYVDYGNCANVTTSELLEYQDEWDEYPAYALHFRINGVTEINPWDRDAQRAAEQLLIADTKATVIDIVHDKQTNRTTYVVDLFDENGLNIAEVLASKNYSLFIKEPAKMTTTKPTKNVGHCA